MSTALRVWLYVCGFTCVALRARLAIHGGFRRQSLALRVTFEKHKSNQNAFSQIICPAGACGILRITGPTGRANAHPCAEALYAAIHGAPTRGSANS